jgi:hypothetical protein
MITPVIHWKEHLLVVVEPDVALIDYPEQLWKVIRLCCTHRFHHLIEVGIEGESCI